MAVAVSRAVELGARHLVAPSAGNAGGALAAYAAASGVRATVVMPSDSPEPNQIEEQLGWRLPDAIVYPTGGGTGLIGMWKAFDELEALGLIGVDRPRMFSVQAEGCAPIVRAFTEGHRDAAA